MKKQWKRLISLLLCAVLLTGIFPVSLHAAETSTTVKVSVNAKVCRQQTREVLRMVNEERAKKGRDPIIMSAEMEEAAIQRAFELVTYCSHARPNGNLYHTVFGEYGVDTNVGYGKWIGENIATGQNDAQQVMASWMDSSGHRDQILAKSFHYIGIGCVEYAGVKYWVQLFAQAPDNVTTAADAGADGIEMTKEYPVDVQYMIGKLNFETTRIEFPEPEVVFAKPGDTLEFDLKLSTPSLISKRNRVVGRINYSSLPPESITISEDAPLTVDEDGIHIDADAKMGTYTVTVTIGSTSAVKKINVTKSGEPCTHPEDRQVIDEKAPTCTEDGYRKVTCGDCEEVISDEVLEKVPHEKENDWYITEEATCTTEGLKVKRCIYCGLEMDTEIIPKSGEHKWDEGTLVKEATCTDTGSTTYTCTLCKTIRTETTEKLGHDELEAITEATCTTTGKKEVTCARCQEVLSSQVISALGHNWGEWQTVTEPTWDADGLEKEYVEDAAKKRKIQFLHFLMVMNMILVVKK